jgi:hypothetical protein
MKQKYSCILSRIQETPKWYDENGVPRYEEFNPYSCADFYCKECALIRISCACCGTTFNVAVSSSLYDVANDLSKRSTLSYGDPPNVECCEEGVSTVSNVEKVLEFWKVKHGALVKEFNFPSWEF